MPSNGTCICCQASAAKFLIDCGVKPSLEVQCLEFAVASLWFSHVQVDGLRSFYTTRPCTGLLPILKLYELQEYLPSSKPLFTGSTSFQFSRAAFAKMCVSRTKAAEMRCTWQLAVRRGYENWIQQTIANPGRLTSGVTAVGCRTLRSATC